METTEDIERSEASAQQDLTRSDEQGLGGSKVPPGRISDSRVQCAQRFEQTGHVCGGLLGDDVDVDGRDRGTVKYGGRAADDDEVDSAATQS
jgi:hypothetical protein